MTKFDELMDIITHNKNNGKNGYIKDEDILFMKTKVKLSIFLFFGLVSLIYVFPFVFVEAAKLESGVTIKEAAPPTNETAPPTNEICNNGIDDNGNGAIDEVTCLPPPAGPAGTCGLQIVSGVPINYGQLNPGQDSAEQKVTIKNVGTATAKIMIKGGNWISDAAGNPTISGPEYYSCQYEYTGYSHLYIIAYAFNK